MKTELNKRFGFFQTALYGSYDGFRAAHQKYRDWLKKKMMPFAIQELQSAYKAYQQFLAKGPPEHHARFVFPFFAGSYFAYRKIDVERVAAIAKAVSDNPSYVDVGCGYGDFLEKVRRHIPDATGIEKEGGIFYEFNVVKPDHVRLMPVEGLSEPINAAFVGWMEPGQDFRKFVAKHAKCVVTTFDAGGQCGINGGCEYEEFGYERIAWWRTPSWIDVNAELMNRYYTPSLDARKKEELARLRSAHNFWYVYARPDVAGKVRSGLQSRLEREDPAYAYDFEAVLDECGFRYNEELPALATGKKLWEVMFD